MKTPLAVDNDNTLYVRDTHTGISPLVRMIDDIPMIRFGKEKYFYYRVDDIIAWHEKELAETNGHSGNRKVFNALVAIREKHQAGGIKEYAGNSTDL